MSNEVVDNNEDVYRSVSPAHYPVDSRTGYRRLSSQAFADRERKISVDRACLCGYNPEYTKLSEKDGVVKISVADIRSIKEIKRTLPDKTFEYQVVDVIADPITGQQDENDNNLAHALIIAMPSYEQRAVFDKLTEKLRILAENQWLIKPIVD